MTEESRFPATSAAHEREHEREHGQDRELLATTLAEQQRFTDSRFDSHAGVHVSERELWTSADAKTDEVAVLHLVAHQEAHRAHQILHEQEQEAVKVALGAESDKAEIHSLGHAEQHRAHEEIHTREREARQVADKAMDLRLASMNAFRDQLRDQAKDYVPLATYQASAAASLQERNLLREDLATIRTQIATEAAGRITRELLDTKVEGAAAIAAADRARLEAVIKALDAKVDGLDKQFDVSSGRRAGAHAVTSQTMAVIGLLITLGVGVIAILANILTSH